MGIPPSPFHPMPDTIKNKYNLMLCLLPIILEKIPPPPPPHSSLSTYVQLVSSNQPHGKPSPSFSDNLFAIYSPAKYWKKKFPPLPAWNLWLLCINNLLKKTILSLPLLPWNSGTFYTNNQLLSLHTCVSTNHLEKLYSSPFSLPQGPRRNFEIGGGGGHYFCLIIGGAQDTFSY